MRGRGGGCVLSDGGLGFKRYCHSNLSLCSRANLFDKVFQMTCYTLFLALFFRTSAPLRHKSNDDDVDRRVTKGVDILLIVLIVLLSSLGGLASNGLNVAVQRDWCVSSTTSVVELSFTLHRATTIASSSPRTLTIINTYLRRVDLICKLLSPLFISLLTTTTTYALSAIVGLGFSALSTIFEVVWVGRVYGAFPSLTLSARSEDEGERRTVGDERRTGDKLWIRFSRKATEILLGIRRQYADLKEFSKLTVFTSSLAMCVLSLL
jgi:solute carrier family 40 (iron-regulated transporter), member 1